MRIVLQEFPKALELLTDYLRLMFRSFEGPDGLNELFQAKVPECLQMWQDRGDAATPLVVERRSYLALFLRRARLAYEMQLHEERLGLTEVCAAWRDGAPNALLDEWECSSQARSYRSWRHAARTGDYATQEREIHAFFDLTFPGCDQELHQHALLNLAQFYTANGGYASARATLQEAIRLAHTVGDMECMRACDGLLEQLAFLDERADSADAWLLTRIPTSDVLTCSAFSALVFWKAERERQRGRPLLHVVQNIADSIWAPRRPDAPPDAPGTAWEPRPSIERSAACPSAVLARTWLQLGAPAQAEAYAAHVDRLGLRMPYGWANLALEAVMVRAIADSERGAYAQATERLVAPSTLQLIDSLEQYAAWLPGVWRIIWLRARRQRNAATLRSIEELCAGPLHGSQERSAERAEKNKPETCGPFAGIRDESTPEQLLASARASMVRKRRVDSADLAVLRPAAPGAGNADAEHCVCGAAALLPRATLWHRAACRDDGNDAAGDAQPCAAHARGCSAPGPGRCQLGATRPDAERVRQVPPGT